jgi:tRNA(fMet)-specific endonuclease VapC
MIQYMLDTNICIYLMNEQPEAVIARFKQCRKGEVVISSITWAELSCGLNIHNNEAQFEDFLNAIQVMPFETKAASLFGELSQKFPNRKNSFDRMIAAHAMALEVILVTNNVSDFELYGITLENWAV